MTTQIANQAARDIIAGDKVEQNVYIGAQTPLSRLYQIFRDDDKASNYTAQIADQLITTARREPQTYAELKKSFRTPHGKT